MDAIKFYDSFAISDVTAKGDYQKLQQDKTDYFALTDDGGICRVDFPAMS